MVRGNFTHYILKWQKKTLQNIIITRKISDGRGNETTTNDTRWFGEVAKRYPSIERIQYWLMQY